MRALPACRSGYKAGAVDAQGAPAPAGLQRGGAGHLAEHAPKNCALAMAAGRSRPTTRAPGEAATASGSRSIPWNTPSASTTKPVSPSEARRRAVAATAVPRNPSASPAAGSPRGRKGPHTTDVEKEWWGAWSSLLLASGAGGRRAGPKDRHAGVFRAANHRGRLITGGDPARMHEQQTSGAIVPRHARARRSPRLSPTFSVSSAEVGLANSMSAGSKAGRRLASPASPEATMRQTACCATRS